MASRPAGLPDRVGPEVPAMRKDALVGLIAPLLALAGLAVVPGRSGAG